MIRRLAALGLGALYVLGVIWGVFVLVLRPPPLPAMAAPAAQSRLSPHVLFVVVDGLRFDVATDPSRMPRFAQAMKKHRSAEILAGRISMTSAAVQNYGTGQRGRFAQIVRNINPDPPPYDNWLKSAAARGQVLALAGDPVWTEMYGDSFRYQLHDPEGVAMDYDFNDRTFQSTRELLAKGPDLLIAHFVTPDHQGHVYGIPSERYAKHIRGFDQDLFALLDEVPRDWTVIVTSDHGAADSGTHGADVLIQRRSPLFAYGPGIAEKTVDHEVLDQSDLANTFAALLGVPGAAHSQGHLLSSWLDVSPEAAAAYACTDAARIVALGRELMADEAPALAARLSASCAQAQPPEERKRAAGALARDVDAMLTSRSDFSSWQAWAFLVATLVGAGLTAWLCVGGSLGAAAVCGGLGLLAIALVAGLERLPGYWPKITDATLFVVFNLPSLLFLLKPERLVKLLDDHPLVAAAVVPGGVAVAYPANLQPVAFALCLAASLVIGVGRHPETWGVGWDRSGTAARLGSWVMLAGWAAAFTPTGISASGAYSSFVQREALTLVLGFALLSSVAWMLVRRRPEALRHWLVAMAIAGACLALRRVVPPWLGRTLLVGLPLVGAALLARGQFRAGFWAVLAGYLFVSRDFELLPIGAGLGIALLLGQRYAQISEAAWTRGRFLLALGVLFCLMFLVRLGVSMGLDALSLDFTAGAFGDRHVPAWWVTFAVIWKYVLVTALVVLTALHHLPGRLASRALSVLTAIGLVRAAVLLGMMQCSQGSFWTTMRVMSDLPFAVLFAVTTALLFPFVSAVARRADEPDGGAPASLEGSHPREPLGDHVRQLQGLPLVTDERLPDTAN